jgi:hypothetical protein
LYGWKIFVVDGVEMYHFSKPLFNQKHHMLPKVLVLKKSILQSKTFRHEIIKTQVICPEMIQKIYEPKEDSNERTIRDIDDDIVLNSIVESERCAGNEPMSTKGRHLDNLWDEFKEIAEDFVCEDGHLTTSRL